MNNTKIEWTETTWNPTTGCTKISSGCKNCYAEKMSMRLKSMKHPKYSNGFKFTSHPELLKEPGNWKKPQFVFVNSMSDLFHEDISLDFIQKVFDVMNKNEKHIFQILTKRAENLVRLAPMLNWTNNIWMGVTVEDSSQKDRISLLKQVPAYIKFLSCEPLLSPLHDLDLAGIDWVIVGGESGASCRPISKEWVTDLQIQCETRNVAFFFKQWGGLNKKKNGKELNGKIYQEFPTKYLIH